MSSNSCAAFLEQRPSSLRRPGFCATFALAVLPAAFISLAGRIKNAYSLSQNR